MTGSKVNEVCMSVDFIADSLVESLKFRVTSPVSMLGSIWSSAEVSSAVNGVSGSV